MDMAKGRVGGKEQISELLMQEEKQMPSRRRQDIFASREMQKAWSSISEVSMARERGRAG